MEAIGITETPQWMSLLTAARSFLEAAPEIDRCLRSFDRNDLAERTLNLSEALQDLLLLL